MPRLIRDVLIPLMLLAPASLPATTIVPFSDSALVDKAPVILLGRVVGKLPNTTERAITNWLVNVERVLKGPEPEGAITVRVPGGETALGEVLRIYGAPTFQDDEEVLLFLNSSRGNDPYEIFQFVQGAFHKVLVGKGTLVVQDLSEVQMVETPSDERTERGNLRDFNAFVHWIEDREAGNLRAADYFYRSSSVGMNTLLPAYTIFPGNPRWFNFDTRGSVSWRNNGSLSGLSGGGGSEFFNALAAWTNEGTTPVKLTYGGTSTGSRGLTSRDGKNVILFGDPNNEIQDVDCANGGTLARGGEWSSGGGTFNGRTFTRIVEGDMVVNNGIECLFQVATNPSKYVEWIFAHELGHTLGIGHSSVDRNEPNPTLRNALMYFSISPGDTRGAQLNSDDVAALQFLYRKSSSEVHRRPRQLGARRELLLILFAFSIADFE